EFIDNAKEFAKPLTKQGRIWIRSEIAGDKCRIHIKDNGPGLKSLIANRKAFRRRRNTIHMHIGLKLARYIIEPFSGTFNECGTIGNGAHFIITLPLFRTASPKCL